MKNTGRELQNISKSEICSVVIITLIHRIIQYVAPSKLQFQFAFLCIIFLEIWLQYLPTA
jgi:hypothetical protein